MSPTMLDISALFSLPRRKPAKRYIAVWPCGARWTVEPAKRGEWSAPIYRDGVQTRVEILADTRTELLEELRDEGAIIERE